MTIESTLPSKSSTENKFLVTIRFIMEMLIPIVAIFFILDIPLMVFRKSYFSQQFIIVFWSLVMVLLFLSVPAKKGAPKNNPQWYDLVAAAISLIMGCYVFYFYPNMVMTAGIIWPIQIFFGIIVTILVIESIRRTAGPTVGIVILIFICYAKWGYMFPGALAASTLSWSRLWQQLLIGSDAMLGIALRIAATTVFAFILFGGVFLKLGAGDFIMEISTALLGGVRGGPAKLAVLSSMLFGTISGAAVANVVATGMFTIPLMKKNGYPDYYAGAVEAVASTGGQLMPPVMGAAAFIMAAYLGIPYQRVIIIAIIPALLYYFGLFVQVDSFAGKHNLVAAAASKEARKSITGILKKGLILIPPLVVLFYFLFVVYLDPSVCALYGIVAIYICALFTKSTRSALWSLSDLVDACKKVSRSMFSIISISAGAGLLIGIIAYTGLGLSFSQILVQAAHGHLFYLALLCAVASAILGMGMPTTPAYIMLAVLAVPALITVGVAPIVAHFYIFYFGTLSMITPPICLSAFAASTISGAPVNKIGWQAVKLGFAGFVVPFIFLYNPSVALISGTVIQKLAVILFTFVAIYLAGVVFEGYAVFDYLSFPIKLFAILGAVILIIPNPNFIHTELLILKIIVTGLVLFYIYIKTKKNKMVISEKPAV